MNRFRQKWVKPCLNDNSPTFGQLHRDDDKPPHFCPEIDLAPIDFEYSGLFHFLLLETVDPCPFREWPLC